MEANRYSTPPAYFSMSLQELSLRAKQNDVFALLQLAEQYWSEGEDLLSIPGYDASKAPRAKAIEFMTAAAGQGHSHAATIVSSMYEIQGDHLQAYAWTLVARQLGDLSVETERTNYENRLSTSQRDTARALAAQEYEAISKGIASVLSRSARLN